MIKRVLRKIKRTVLGGRENEHPGSHLFRKYDPEAEPADEEIEQYYDEFVEHMKQYEKGLPPRFSVAFEKLDGMVESGMEVLDLGCGTGITTEYIAGLGAQALGVDLSPRTIDFARQQRPGVDFTAGDITRINLEKTFDLICMIDVLEHIPARKREALWDNLRLHTKTGGRVFISIPSPEHILKTRKKNQESFQIVDEAVPLDEMAGALAARGFREMEREYMTLSSPRDAVQFIFEKQE